MKHTILISTLVFPVLLPIVTSNAIAQTTNAHLVPSSVATEKSDLPQKFTSPDGFTIYLPRDWTLLPKEEAQFRTDEAARRFPKAPKQVYSYAFQLKSAPHPFDPPYIGVQVKRFGRITDAQLKSIKQLMDDGLAEAKDMFSSLVQNPQMETAYDGKAHIIWSWGSGVVEDSPRKFLVGTLLTEEGVIEVMCSTKLQGAPQYFPLFRSIIRGVVVVEKLAYRRTTSGLPKPH